MLKNGTSASPATALASSVLPVPGGPTSSTPLGMRPPRAWYFSGVLRKSTISRSSATASSMPATSSKVILSVLLGVELVLAAAEGERRVAAGHPAHDEKAEGDHQQDHMRMEKSDDTTRMMDSSSSRTNSLPAAA